MKYFLLLFIPFLLYGEVIFDKINGDFALKVSISSPKISLDQDFKLQIEMSHPSDYVIDRKLLRNSVMKPNARGIYPLFLAKETDEKSARKTSITYHLKPQYPGKFTLTLSFTAKNKSIVPLHGILGTIPSGIFRSLILGVFYSRDSS